jgi:hypothetical protein
MRIEVDGQHYEVPDDATPAEIDALTRPAPAPSRTESLLRGAGQGATLGFGDEMAAGVGALIGNSNQPTFGARYKEIRDSLRRENKAASDAHPGYSFAGNVLGGAPLAIATGGGSEAPTAARLVGMGAALGGASGLGNSDAESLGGMATATGLGAGLGGALSAAGAFAPQLGRALGKSLDKVATGTVRRILRNVGGSISAKKGLSDEAAREVLDVGAIKPFGTSKGAATRLEAIRETVGDQYGKIVKALEANGITGPDADALAQKLAAEGAATAADTMNPAVPKVYADAAEQLADKPTIAGRLSLSRAENLKRSLQSSAKSAYQQMQPGELAQAHEGAASMLRQSVEDEIAQQAAASGNPQVQAIAAQFEPVKKQAGRIIEASNVAREGVNRAANRNAVSLTDMLAASGGLAHGGNPLEAGAMGILAHLLRTRGPSTLATAAHGGANALEFLTGPALTPGQRQTQMLLQALRRTALPAASQEAGTITQ